MSKSQTPEAAPTRFDSLTVGLDWANDKHDYCILDPKGKILRQGVIKHSHAEVSALIRSCLELLTPNGRIHLGCESATNAIGRLLCDFDRVDLHLIHPGAEGVASASPGLRRGTMSYPGGLPVSSNQVGFGPLVLPGRTERDEIPLGFGIKIVSSPG